MKKRVSFLVLALLIAISGCGKSERSLNRQDSSEEINANGTGEDGEQNKTGAGDAADKEADTAELMLRLRQLLEEAGKTVTFGIC